MLKTLAAGTFYGTTTVRRELAGLVFAESVYRDRLRIPRHEHANAFVNLVVEGTYTETCGVRSRTRGPSTLAIHPCGEAHADQWHTSGGRVFHVDFAPSFLERVRAYSKALDVPQDLEGGLPVWLATRLYQEHLSDDGASSLAMEGLTFEMLAECSRHGSKNPERGWPRWLLALRELLHERFRDNLSHDAIAVAVGVHPMHMARVFRRRFGCSLGTYVRRLRVEFACFKLRSTDEPLAEIAVSAGFSDQSHFTRVFKQQIGMTPATFKKLCRSR